jgi:uncharacterized protein (TIGR02301 family)
MGKVLRKSARFRAAFLAATLVLALSPAFAQEAGEGEATEDTEVETPEVPAEAVPEAPYDERLERLSEIVGSVHYLHGLCAAKPDERWRELMVELLDAEMLDPRRRARMTAAFNRGYRAFASVYTECTPAAAAARARYRSEGATLASEIIARYGN